MEQVRYSDSETLQNAREILHQTFGYNEFREGQFSVIEQLAHGGDALSVMPTGAGKSICYEIAALLRDGIALVISPLISLMKDQVSSLLQLGVKAAYLNASLTPKQMNIALSRARQYQYKIIYIAPERLEAPDFVSFINSVDISLVAVDEAHCVSQWGQDFRPSYLKIKSFVETLKSRPPVGAFTATATARVREDIEKLLGLHAPLALVTGYDRPNLFFSVKKPKRKEDALFKIIRQREGKSGIIYCATRKAVEEVTRMLAANGYPATRYHAGLSDEERHNNQDDFIYDKKLIMVATNAFGMGIDKSNVSFVVHYNMPKDLESYYQEAGRAGRDGSRADCILLYAKQDVITCQYLIEHSEENAELSAEMREERLQKDRERLKKMTFFATTNDCLRAFILRYFGENANRHCGNCGNCQTKFEEVDATDHAERILACVARLHAARRTLGAHRLVGVLRGMDSEKPILAQMRSLPEFGCLAALRKDDALMLIEELLAREYLEKAEGDYPTIEPGPRADTFEKPFLIKRGIGKQYEERVEPKPLDTLFKRLKALRLRIAGREHKPAYIIMTDATLVEISSKRPLNPEEFADISGVGRSRAEKYANEFVSEIRNYLDEDI